MKRDGFTFIELVVAAAVLAILASAVFPVARMAVKRGKEIELKYNLRQIRRALDDYKKAYDDKKMTQKVGESGYPPTLNTLVEGVSDATDPEKKRRLYFLRRIPRDPFNTDRNLKPEETWGKRSYASDADRPTEGEDVYDVFSLSEEKAIDGTSYKEW